MYRVDRRFCMKLQSQNFVLVVENLLDLFLHLQKREEVKEETGQLEVDIDKLKRDIKVEGNTQGNTLQDLWGSVSQSEAQAGGLGGDFSRPASSEPDGQELLDKIQRDCASSRMRDIDES